jgi:hypothetical protein
MVGRGAVTDDDEAAAGVAVIDSEAVETAAICCDELVESGAKLLLVASGPPDMGVMVSVAPSPRVNVSV